MLTVADAPVDWTATVDPQTDAVVVQATAADAAPYLVFRSDNSTTFDPATAVLVGTSTADSGTVVDATLSSTVVTGPVTYGVVPHLNSPVNFDPARPIPSWVRGCSDPRLGERDRRTADAH